MYSHEELGAVGVLAPVGHGQEEGSVVFENKVLICLGRGIGREKVQESKRLALKTVERCSGQTFFAKKVLTAVNFCSNSAALIKSTYF